LSQLPEEGGTPIEEPFVVLNELAKEFPGSSPLRLPENVTGGSVAVLLLAPEPLSWTSLMIYVMPFVSGALLTLACQLYTIYRVGIIVRHQEIECSEGDLTLRLVCLGVFKTTMVNGLKTLLDVHRYLHRIPAGKHRETLMMQRFQDTGTPAKNHFQVRSVTKIVSRITNKCRAQCYAILLVKVSALLMLSYYGSGYILHSAGDEELILNSVALCFVVDMDTYIYDFVANGTVKTYISSLPTVGLTSAEKNSSTLLALDEYWPMLSMVFLGAIMATNYAAWCEAPLGLSN